jgi:hypothetical protein
MLLTATRVRPLQIHGWESRAYFQPFVQADSSCPSSGRSNLTPDRPEVMKLR